MFKKRNKKKKMFGHKKLHLTKGGKHGVRGKRHIGAAEASRDME